VDVRARKEWLAIKIETMKNYDRDLLVLYKADMYNEDLLQHEVECLHKILLQVENSYSFCKAHELATRNRITSKTRSIMKATTRPELKAFHFLINKN
jgi:hypothetical protein